MKELIVQLQDAVYRLNIEGHRHQADAVKQAIAALSAKPSMESSDPCGCGTKAIGDDKYTVSVCAAHLQGSEPAKLPEVEELYSVNAFILANKWEPAGQRRDVLWASTVRTYLQQLTAAHAAELAMKDIEIRRLQMVEDAVNHELVTIEASIECYPSPRAALNRLLEWHSEVALNPLVSSEARALIEQGRREALMGVPVDALESALSNLQWNYQMSRAEAGTSTNHESLRQEHEDCAKSLRSYIENLEPFIESARAAQQEKTK